MGNLFIVMGRMKCAINYRWRAAKSIEFILKSYLYLTMRKSNFS